MSTGSFSRWLKKVASFISAKGKISGQSKNLCNHVKHWDSSCKGKAKTLIRLHGCAVLSESLLITYIENNMLVSVDISSLSG